MWIGKADERVENMGRRLGDADCSHGHSHASLVFWPDHMGTEILFACQSKHWFTFKGFGKGNMEISIYEADVILTTPHISYIQSSCFHHQVRIWRRIDFLEKKRRQLLFIFLFDHLTSSSSNVKILWIHDLYHAYLGELKSKKKGKLRMNLKWAT